MKQVAQNTFAGGLRMDLNPLATPNNILTDCLNGTVITYNGNEFVLQNDMGNAKVSTARLAPGFIPMGMKEYGGVIYVASYNPVTGDCEVGSFPSPQRDFSTSDFNELQPANFRTSQFILETSTTTEQNTKHIGKLSEPELFELHPGDMYVIVFDITDPNPPADPGQPNKIDSVTKMDNWISKDPANRKLFALRFYKITDSANLIQLDPTKIKVIQDQPNIDDEYVYFTENSNSTLAVGLEVEQLDLFDANVIDSSRATDPNKKVTIEAIGKSASLNDFQGIKVQVTSPVTDTFYLDKATGTKKVSALLDGMAENDEFQCSITPYSPYCLFPKLRKDFRLTLGKYLSNGSGVNDIFQYYLDTATNTLRVDFDFKFQGDSIDGVHLYVEFYDPWSDYSIVKRVDNPTYYGLNSIVMDLVNEPRSETFDSTTVGGTPATKLIDNPDTEYEKTMLNSTNKIRIDTALRLNHFYIVRISGVDRTITDGVIGYTHYDLYKGLYSSDMFNSVYEGQAAASVTDPGYVSDFNALDFKLDVIGYKTTITQSFLNPLAAQNQNYPNIQVTDPDTGNTTTQYPLMTNGDWYAISDSYTGSLNYKHESTYETDAEYNVNLDLTGQTKLFGDIKPNMLTITFPTLIDSDASGSGVKPTIVEQNVPGTPATGSKATWNATQLSDTQYIVDLSLTTTRNITATAKQESKTGYKYKEVSLEKSFAYFPNGNSPFTGSGNGQGWIEFSGDPNQYRWINNDNGTVQTQSGMPDETPLYNKFTGYTKKYSGYWGGMANRAQFWWWRGAPGSYGDKRNGDGTLRQNILFMPSVEATRIMPCRTHNINVAIDFFKTLKVASNVTSALTLYSPDKTTFSKNGQLKTTAQFTGANITTSFTPDEVSSVYVKTYLSTFHFQALGTTEEFNPTVINDYIASRKGDSTIVDNKQTIRDGFIPFITQVEQTTYQMVFDDIVIDQASDSDVLGAMMNGGVIGAQSPVFVSLGTYKPHGLVFSGDSAKYITEASYLRAEGVTSGVEIDENTIWVSVKGSAAASWQGFFRIGGDDTKYDAPDLMQNFQLT